MNELLLSATNALTLADDLVAHELKSRKNALERVDVELLKRQLEHVLQTARRVTGLEPDGSFKPLPKPRANGKRGAH